MGLDIYDYIVSKYGPLIIFWTILTSFIYVPNHIKKVDEANQFIVNQLQNIEKQKVILASCLPENDSQSAHIGTDGKGGYICSKTVMNKGLMLVVRKRVMLGSLL